MLADRRTVGAAGDQRHVVPALVQARADGPADPARPEHHDAHPATLGRLWRGMRRAAARVERDMDLGRWVLLVAVVGALAFGGWRAVSDGRFRGTHRVRAAVSSPRPPEAPRRPTGEADVEPVSTPLDRRRAVCCRDGVRRAARRARDAPAVLLRLLRPVPRDPPDPGRRRRDRPGRDARRGRRRGASRPGPASRRPADADHARARRGRARDHPSERRAATGPGARRPGRGGRVMSTMWMGVSQSGTRRGGERFGPPTVPSMSSTHLTRRRAVDHCRVRSSLCRMS